MAKQITTSLDEMTKIIVAVSYAISTMKTIREIHKHDLSPVMQRVLDNLGDAQKRLEGVMGEGNVVV